MAVLGAKEKIHSAMIKLEGINSGEHRFGGTEYKLGKREIGHVHGNYLVDIPFPIQIRNELIEKGEAEPHHILPESGWISFYIKNDIDVDKVIKLLKRSFEIASEYGSRAKTKQSL